jgi:hypothetical protein
MLLLFAESEPTLIGVLIAGIMGLAGVISAIALWLKPWLEKWITTNISATESNADANRQHAANYAQMTASIGSTLSKLAEMQQANNELLREHHEMTMRRLRHGEGNEREGGR